MDLETGHKNSSGGFFIMADEGTSSTLVLIAAVLQLIFFFVLVVLTAFFAFLLAVVPTIPPSYLPPGSLPIAEFMTVMLRVTILFVVMTVIALIFSILWFLWRSVPGQHKIGLIITGVIALILAGVIPGILVIVGGAIASKAPTTVPTSPSTPPSKTLKPEGEAGVKYCPSCGNPISDPKAQFCGVCGASVD
jgi:hypothetical protein